VSAIYLVASLGIPFRKRIVHVHNTDEGIPTPNALKKFLFKEPMRQTCVRLSDHVVGISKETLFRFTRDTQMKPGRDRVVYYGVDTSVFHEPIGSREQFRKHLGFPADAKVLLFAGRMVSIKNPVFVIDVLSELAKKDPKAVAVFAGAGNLEQTVTELAASNNLSGKVRVLGWRDDVSKLMRLSDLLVFPRLEEPKEGLGLVLVEAQAAGLPVLASPSITSDVQVVPELFQFLPLAAGPEAWANKAAEMLSHDFISPQKALRLIEASQFSLDAGVSSLLSLYSDVNADSPEGSYPLAN
jgi:glycosyltransferase involved in cell wall biosynthesis